MDRKLPEFRHILFFEVLNFYEIAKNAEAPTVFIRSSYFFARRFPIRSFTGNYLFSVIDGKLPAFRHIAVFELLNPYEFKKNAKRIDL